MFYEIGKSTNFIINWRRVCTLKCITQKHMVRGFDGGLCYFVPIRNNYCENLATYDVKFCKVFPHHVVILNETRIFKDSS